ncbi:MAG: guanylate kinase [Candidatus Algichlamydia australiensis]|nr:guanylate kinase [Chlamydiales bacterium]
MSSRGKLFIVSAPAGSGKTTLVEMLCNERKDCVRSVSCTTRAVRGREIDGIDYFFLSPEEFEKKSLAGEFLEEAKVYEDRYGTLKSFVEERLTQGKHVFLVIDTQGALKLKGKVEAIWVFIVPPSIKVLRERLIGRGTETAEDIEKRLAWARSEMKKADEYDYTVVNDDLNTAFMRFKEILNKCCADSTS